MNTMRSHRARSSTECVVNTTVADRSASWRRRAISSALVTGSRPDVGSSRKKTCGSVSSSTAMLARLRCPPLSEPTRTSACSVRPDGVDRVTDRVVDLGRGRRRREPQPRRVAERASERQVGMDDVVLRHVAEHAAERPQVGVQVDAVEAHRPRGRRGDAGDRLQQRRLAGAARTDDRDELTSRERERHGVEERQLASVADPDPPGQLVDVDADTPGGDAGAGSSRLRSFRRTLRSVRRARHERSPFLLAVAEPTCLAEKARSFVLL